MRELELVVQLLFDEEKQSLTSTSITSRYHQKYNTFYRDSFARRDLLYNIVMMLCENILQFVANQERSLRKLVILFSLLEHVAKIHAYIAYEQNASLRVFSRRRINFHKISKNNQMHKELSLIRSTTVVSGFNRQAPHSHTCRLLVSFQRAPRTENVT